MKPPATKVRRLTSSVVPRARVALDTAVLLRALLLSDTKSKRLRQAWQAGEFQPLIAATSARALMKALAFPALKLDATQQHELLADFLPYAEVVVECSAKRAQSPALDLVRSAQAVSSVDCLVSDCPSLRRAAGRTVKALSLNGCQVLGSEEFLSAMLA